MADHLAYMVTMLKILFLNKINRRKTVSLVRLSGLISSGSRGGISDSALGSTLDKAFKKGNPSAVAFIINSPGGSPVQSSLVGDRIKRLSEETKVPTIAFVEDVAASGGYWIASAADEIYADHASIIGSIGVISSGFGLHELLARYGVERRVYTAGQSKSMLDPFKKEKAEDVKRLKDILSQLHEVFIAHVNTSRAGKLSADQDLFTGEIWLAARAKEIGLIDGIGHVVPVLKERFGEKTRFKEYSQKKSLSQRFGVSITKDAISLVEERAAFSKYGL